MDNDVIRYSVAGIETVCHGKDNSLVINDWAQQSGCLARCGLV